MLIIYDYSLCCYTGSWSFLSCIYGRFSRSLSLPLFHIIPCFRGNVFKHRHQVKDSHLLMLTAEAVLCIVNPLSVLTVVWLILHSSQNGNKCINNVVGKIRKIKNIKQGSNAFCSQHKITNLNTCHLSTFSNCCHLSCQDSPESF